MEQPLNQHEGWKRKKTGEYFWMGMKKLSQSNKKPPIDES